MVFPKIFRRKEETPQQPVLSLPTGQAGAAEGPVPSSQDPCRHLALAARWGKVHDVGSPQRPAVFRCTECGTEFSVEDAHEVGRRHLVTW